MKRREAQDGRWTGRQGEKTFDLQCSLEHVTCNPAIEDDKGWDFFIQFPDRPSPLLLADEQPTALSAQVQVKTTMGAIKNWSISLQNALNLVRSPLAAFIVVYTTQEGGLQAHGIHLWRKEIARILLAVRQAEEDGDTKLNHMSITFPFNEATRRLDVLSWIRTEIEAVGRDYATQKAMVRDTVGFEGPTDVILMSGRGLSEERFLDLQLGLIDGVDADLLTVTSKRFGIEARQPRLSFEGVRVHMTPTGTDARLKLRAPDGDTLFVPAKIFYASGSGSRRYKARAVARCIEVLSDHRGNVSVDAHLPYDKITSLEEIDTFGFLQCAGNRGKVAISLDSIAGPIDLGFLKITTAPADQISWTQMRFNIAALRAVAAYEGVPAIETSIGGLGSVLGPLVVLDALTCARSVKIDFIPVDDSDGEKFTLHLSFGSVLIHGQVIGVVACRPVVNDTYAADRREVHLGPARILSAVHGGDAARLRANYLDELDQLSESHLVLATGDMMQILDEAPAGGRPLIVDEPRTATANRRPSLLN